MPFTTRFWANSAEEVNMSNKKSCSNFFSILNF
jgi:hypothetical protein